MYNAFVCRAKWGWVISEKSAKVDDRYGVWECDELGDSPVTRPDVIFHE